MGAADAYQHTDSNRNDDGSDVVHGTLKAEIGFGESSSNPIIYTNDYNGETKKKKPVGTSKNHSFSKGTMVYMFLMKYSMAKYRYRFHLALFVF